MDVSRFEVLSPFKVRIQGKGIVTLPRGQVLRLAPDKARPLMEQGIVSPLPPHSGKDPINLIEEVIREIEEEYAFGAIKWVRRTKPKLWRRIVTLEEEINRAAKNHDMLSLKRLLTKWRTEIRNVVETFLAEEQRQMNLFC